MGERQRYVAVRLKSILLVIAAILCFTVVPAAVAEPAAAEAEAKDQVEPDKAPLAADGDDDAEANALQALIAETNMTPVGQIDMPPTLQERFNGVLDTINGAVFTTLFFDMSNGAFRNPKLEDGEPVYAKTPEMIEASQAFSAFLVDAEGNIVKNKDGNPTVVRIEAGQEYQPVDADGLPQVVTGEVVMEGPTMPFLVVWLGVGAVFFTVWHGFLNIRGMKHAIDVVRGKYAKPTDAGDISPFQALTSALSATVGLGNIAGVAIAMTTGGPGALFWMMVLGFFGMSSKFHESALAQMFRIKNKDGTVSGGPMYVLDHGFKKHLPMLWPLGKALAMIFAFFCMFAALGGGNMFQSNQAYEGFFSTFVMPHIAAAEVDAVQTYLSYGFGILLAGVVATVVLGGITRIGAATSKIVPAMALLYITACLVIVVVNINELPNMVVYVFSHAFGLEAMYGGLIGALIVGFQRAAFSSEAGMGSSAIAHAAAKTDEPVREGFVASLEPFIDTVVICFLTGMVVLITGAYQVDDPGASGAAITLLAFEKNALLSSWFPYVLSISIILFAFSTMIAWCYYGERAAGYLLGEWSIVPYRILFVICVFVGAVASLESVIDSADASLLSMGLPNILGGILLAMVVKRRVDKYMTKLRTGEFDKTEYDASI